MVDCDRSTRVYQAPLRQDKGFELNYGLGMTAVFAELAARRAQNGTIQNHPDTLLAALPLAHGLVVVTRNVRHFTDLAVHNPWPESPKAGR